MRRKCRGLIDLDKIAVHYNNRLRGRTVMVLPGSCPHSMVVTIGNCRHKVNMFLKGYSLEAKTASKKCNYSVHISWARLASFCHLGFISDPLIVSKFHNETHDKVLDILLSRGWSQMTGA